MESREGIEIEAVRRAARIALALVLLAGGLLLLPGPTARVLSPNATAQIVPTPTLPPLPGGDPSPVPNPFDDDDDDDGGGDGSQDGDGSDGGSEPQPSEDEGENRPSGKGNKKGGGKKDARGGRPGGGAFVGGPVPSGSFSTDRLLSAATQLTGLGVPRSVVLQKVFPPFILAGEAAWTNTWGAPRYGPGTLVRTHEGQDVFCRYGDPVLAPETGVMSYSDSGLGGITARVHTSSSSYWYLTHLSATNADDHPGGSIVEPGDVIGFCGNSGNAATTPPHVHFGWYVNGKARNPMRALVTWLHSAERRVGVAVAEQSARVVRQSDSLTVARRFGDAFTSDLSIMDLPYEFLQAATRSDASGPATLAEMALQAALERAAGGAPDDGKVAVTEPAGTPADARRLKDALTGISDEDPD